MLRTTRTSIASGFAKRQAVAERRRAKAAARWQPVLTTSPAL
jgi:hypothetical protein